MSCVRSPAQHLCSHELGHQSHSSDIAAVRTRPKILTPWQWNENTCNSLRTQDATSYSFHPAWKLIKARRASYGSSAMACRGILGVDYLYLGGQGGGGRAADSIHCL